MGKLVQNYDVFANRRTCGEADAQKTVIVPTVRGSCLGWCLYWVAVKELKLSYYIGETLVFTIYSHYGNLI